MSKLGLIAGLPRSGSTFLLSLIRQREDTKVAESSLLPYVARFIQRDLSTDDAIASGIGIWQQHSMLARLVDTVAESKKHYVDMNRVWALPYFLHLADSMSTEQPPIVVQVRPLSEVVASFVALAQKNPGNYIDRCMRAEDFYPLSRKAIDDARVDWLLTPNGLIGECLLGLANVMNSDRRSLIVTHERLVREPLAVLWDIENIFGMEHEAYDLENPVILERDDHKVFGIGSLHSVMPSGYISMTKPKDVLSHYALSRCEAEDFWT